MAIALDRVCNEVQQDHQYLLQNTRMDKWTNEFMKVRSVFWCNCWQQTFLAVCLLKCCERTVTYLCVAIFKPVQKVTQKEEGGSRIRPWTYHLVRDELTEMYIKYQLFLCWNEKWIKFSYCTTNNYTFKRSLYCGHSVYSYSK